jgi:ribosome-binding factor A
VYDDSFERGQKVSALLDELREERDGRQFTSEELAAVEDTISNPYDDDDDDDEWMEELGGSEDDDGEVEDEDGNNR